MAAFFRSVVSIAAAISLAWCLGCTDDTDAVRRIRSQRQQQMQATEEHDHLGEMFNLLGNLVELNSDEARRQIAYHLNRWSDDRGPVKNPTVTPLVGSVSELLPPEAVQDRIIRSTFTRDDVDHLRDCYLYSRVAEWVDSDASDDPVLAEWFSEFEKKSKDENAVVQLRTASRLFDWTTRNIAFEPEKVAVPPIPPPSLPFGMQLQGAGYRQSDYETLWRGTGDALQRMGVFTQLCRQAEIPAIVLAIPSKEGSDLNPWCVGVLIADQIYLFDPTLGIFIPGPNRTGIATLAQARSDESVLRRLNVPGFFEYPVGKDDVQQCIALLNLIPEAISPRMSQLQSGLAGDRRMVTYTDADALAKRLDAIPGIAGVRLWDVPLLAEYYHQGLETAAQRDPLFNFWYFSRWAILEAQINMSRQLALGRWRHLHGDFDKNVEDDSSGARVLYLGQRAPEFEIEDLRIDVELQKAYGIRRELGTASEVYDRQVQQIQSMMRQGKITATYWISLIQYDDRRYKTAETWFSKRVLDGVAESQWEPAARYNLARTEERLGNIDRAVELYKTDGDPQEHGNRIRARLISKSAD